MKYKGISKKEKMPRAERQKHAEQQIRDVIGKTINGGKIVEWVKQDEKEPPSRGVVKARCTICGFETNVIAYTILNNKSKSCVHCKNRKYPKELTLVQTNKEIGKLNQIWRKYKNDFVDEGKNDFKVYADFMLKAGGTSSKCGIRRKNIKINHSPENTFVIKMKKPRKP